VARVVLEDISKVYPNNVLAVAPTSLEIEDGEFVVLVGPSGCGKSTTLRMVAGLETATTGTIKIGERVVNDVEPKDRNIAMVFQSYALYPHMSVKDNLAFGLKMRKVPRPEIQQKVADVAEVLGISELLERKPRALSGGQRQRVALGRAIVRDPDVFLFDEPLSNLDAKMRVQMRTEISRLHHHLDATMIYVTHDQVEAMTLGQRIVVMNAGEVQQVDTPLNLYERPVNRFVAGFIGSPAMNFVTGRLVREEGLGFVPGKDKPAEQDVAATLPPADAPEAPAQAARSEHEAAAIPLPAGFDVPAPVLGHDLVMGIRPEHVAVEVEPFANSFPLTVQVIEPLGNETLLYFGLAAEPFVVRAPGKIDLAVDGTAHLAVSAAHLHFFSPENGRSLLR
jgi:multiple sugar transport system ATP-binding protein